MLDKQQLQELLLQSLEHERGGVDLYETAIECAVSEDLAKEWSEYLEQTRTHVQILERVFKKFEIDPEQASPGRQIVGELGAALVAAMRKAKAAGNATAAQLVACECVVLAETKDHANWELLGKCAEQLTGRTEERAARGLRDRRGPGGRAPLSQQGLLPGVVARFAGPSRRAAAARRTAPRHHRDRGSGGRAGKPARPLTGGVEQPRLSQVRERPVDRPLVAHERRLHAVNE